MNYLPVDVYRNATFGDCSNDGVSARSNVIYIQCEDGNFREDEIPAHLRFKIDEHSDDYWRAVHVHPPKGCITAGGNLAYSSDSRCNRVLHIHDRVEHERLSR